jgi:hypothetical protein
MPRGEVVALSRWEAGAEEKTTGERRLTFLFERPRKFRLTMGTAPTFDPELLSVGDEKTVSTYMPIPNLYASSAAIGAKAGLERNIIVAQALVGTGLDIVIRPDMTSYVLGNAAHIVDRGVEKNDEVAGRHFSLTWGDARAQLWFSEEKPPRLIRFKRSTRLPSPDGKTNFDVDIESDLTWKADPEISATTFRLGHSTTARKVPDLYAAIAGDTNALGPKAIDKIDLISLDGSRFNIDASRPSLVFVVGAWAEDTRRLLALLAKQADALGSTPVIVVVVADDADEAKWVLPEKSPAWTIAIDRQGDLAAALNQESLPILVALKSPSAPWHQPIDEETFADTLAQAKAALAAPSP